MLLRQCLATRRHACCIRARSVSSGNGPSTDSWQQLERGRGSHQNDQQISLLLGAVGWLCSCLVPSLAIFIAPRSLNAAAENAGKGQRSQRLAGRCRRSDFKNGMRDKVASQKEAVKGAIAALVVASSARTVAWLGASAATVGCFSEAEVGHHGRSKR